MNEGMVNGATECRGEGKEEESVARRKREKTLRFKSAARVAVFLTPPGSGGHAMASMVSSTTSYLLGGDGHGGRNRKSLHPRSSLLWGVQT